MTEVRFAAGSAWTIEDARLVYRESEHSFGVTPWQGGGVSSVLVNDINLEVDEDGLVLFPWGLCPRATWMSTILEVPSGPRRRLMIRAGAPTIPGTSRRLTPGERWPVYLSAQGPWICVGQPQPHDGQVVIEFSPGAMAVLDDGAQLEALWMRVSPA